MKIFEEWSYLDIISSFSTLVPLCLIFIFWVFKRNINSLYKGFVIYLIYNTLAEFISGATRYMFGTNHMFINWNILIHFYIIVTYIFKEWGLFKNRKQLLWISIIAVAIVDLSEGIIRNNMFNVHSIGINNFSMLFMSFITCIWCIMQINMYMLKDAPKVVFYVPQLLIIMSLFLLSLYLIVFYTFINEFFSIKLRHKALLVFQYLNFFIKCCLFSAVVIIMPKNRVFISDKID